jgi:hypothetical protein
MRLVYVDEAGISAGEPFLVVGGVALHADRQLIALEKALDSIVATWIPHDRQRGFVFHAKDLFNGGGVFRRDDPRWPLARRLELADQLAALPASHDLKLTLGVVWKAEHEKPPKEPPSRWTNFLHGLAFLSCATVLDSWMRDECPGEICMVIAEDNDQARSMIKSLMRMIQDQESQRLFSDTYKSLYPLRHIKEDPLFSPKRSSSVLQLADFWAYVAKRHFLKDQNYERFWVPMRPSLAPTIWPNRAIPD